MQAKSLVQAQRAGLAGHSSCEALVHHKNVEGTEIRLSVAIYIERLCFHSTK